MELIDKAAVVAEIERKIRNIDYEGLSDRNIGQKQSLYHILSFLNTLKVKKVDLEKEINQYFEKTWTFEEDDEDIIAFARHFFELGLKTKGG